jgi:membrane-bound lytic murein transglycosylase D
MDITQKGFCFTRKILLQLLISAPFVSVVTPGWVQALPPLSQQLSTQNSDHVFSVPTELRGRVDFWKDVFTRYGKYQQIIHHREFPQVRFGVIDLSLEGESMHPVEFERFKKAESERRVKEIHRALDHLAQGGRPSNLLEDIVAREMRSIRGGPEKYQRAVKEDLVRTQTGIKERYADAVKRAGRYMPIMEKIFVEEFALPRELTRLPFVESSFDYTAYSSVGAAGIWQFMPRTAKSYKLAVNTIVDQRRDPILATRAAAQYLKGAYSELGNWPLALTSYNHGVGGVRKKVNQYGTTDLVKLIEHPSERPFGFASSNFYPEFLAAVEIYRDWRILFPQLEIDPPLTLKSYQVESAVNINSLARHVGIDADALRGVNYALSSAVWNGRALVPRGYQLYIPTGETVALARFRGSDNEPQPKGPSSSTVYGGITYKVRQGDSLISIAKKYNVTTNQLIATNPLARQAMQIGQDLIIQPAPKQLQAASLNQKTRPASVVREATYHTVKKGETLSSIAKRYKVSVQALKNVNRIKSSSISVNQKLKIP